MLAFIGPEPIDVFFIVMIAVWYFDIVPKLRKLLQAWLRNRREREKEAMRLRQAEIILEAMRLRQQQDNQNGQRDKIEVRRVR